MPESTIKPVAFCRPRADTFGWSRSYEFCRKREKDQHERPGEKEKRGWGNYNEGGKLKTKSQ